ncbi:hypothetical protein REH81_18255 [Vibrio rotiferianus]
MELKEATDLIIKDKQTSSIIVVIIMIVCALLAYRYNCSTRYYFFFGILATASVLDWVIVRYRVAKGFYGNNETECRELIARAMKVDTGYFRAG